MKNKLRHVFSKRPIIQSLESKIISKSTPTIRVADALVRFFGTANFLFISLIITVVWIIINLGFIPGITPFDPFPFILLTMVASVGAIFMTVVILISQNRQSYVNTLRSELLLQMMMISERELTKALRLLARSRISGRNTKDFDKELDEMLKDTDVKSIERILAKQLKSETIIDDK